MIVYKIPSLRPRYHIARNDYFELFVRSLWHTRYREFWTFETLGM